MYGFKFSVYDDFFNTYSDIGIKGNSYINLNRNNLKYWKLINVKMNSNKVYTYDEYNYYRLYFNIEKPTDEEKNTIIENVIKGKLYNIPFIRLTRIIEFDLKHHGYSRRNYNYIFECINY